jgi:hypothetical protein
MHTIGEISNKNKIMKGKHKFTDFTQVTVMLAGRLKE